MTEGIWPVLPEVPNGMRLRVRRDEALAAAADAEDRLEAAEKAFGEADQEDREHELQAPSLPPEKWTATAQELGGARRAAGRYLALARGKRDEAFRDLVAAEIALEQHALHAECRRSNELLLDLASKAEAFEAALLAWYDEVALPGGDGSLRIERRGQIMRLFNSILFRAIGVSVSPVRSIDARGFAAGMIVTPTDGMLRRVAAGTDERMQDHWLNCRKTGPARYRSERGRRKTLRQAPGRGKILEEVEAS